MKQYLFAGGLAAVLMLGACGGENTEEETTGENIATEEETTETDTATKETTEEETEETETVERDENSSEIKAMENGEFEIQMAKVKVTNTEVLPPDEYSETGKDRLLVTYETTSKVSPEEAGDVEVTPTNVWIATVELTQETPDTIQTLNVGGIPLEEEYNKYLDTQTSVIKKDKTIENVTVYELENRDNPVILKATQGIGGKELGQMEIDVME